MSMHCPPSSKLNIGPLKLISVDQCGSLLYWATLSNCQISPGKCSSGTSYSEQFLKCAVSALLEWTMSVIIDVKDVM